MAISADAVVLSIYIDPCFIVVKIPFFPIATSFRSSSFPTHVNTKSAPAAASAGVSALDL